MLKKKIIFTFDASLIFKLYISCSIRINFNLFRAHFLRSLHLCLMFYFVHSKSLCKWLKIALACLVLRATVNAKFNYIFVLVKLADFFLYLKLSVLFYWKQNNFVANKNLKLTWNRKKFSFLYCDTFFKLFFFNINKHFFCLRKFF